jgi:hypothetical protein
VSFGTWGFKSPFAHQAVRRTARVAAVGAPVVNESSVE